MKKKWVISLSLSTVIVILIGFSMIGVIMSDVEHPPYTLIDSDNIAEIRSYDSMLIAEVQVSGERKKAISEGFRLLADFIFGNNSIQESIAMTAPVQQQEGESIAMTAPVQQQQDGNLWSIRFIMPSIYTMTSLPKPNNPIVKIRETSPTKYAVIQFSGLASNTNISYHQEKLANYITDKQLNKVGEPLYAFYNPPWTLPFLRRNEIMIAIQ